MGLFGFGAEQVHSTVEFTQNKRVEIQVMIFRNANLKSLLLNQLGLAVRVILIIYTLT
jgi:hypothetical protein